MLLAVEPQGSTNFSGNPVDNGEERVSRASQATADDVTLTLGDLPHLQRVLEKASMVWYPLGMKLDFDAETLTGIAKAAGNDSTTALTLVLTRWLNSGSKHRPPLLQSIAYYFPL